jgi:signal transduction histidine kinase
LELILVSLLIGVFVTNMLSHYFFGPIKKLRSAMSKVEQGDLTVKLDDSNGPKEIRDVNAGFNLMVDGLKSTETLQADFISCVSHEFKTPLNAIEGYTTLLQGCENLDETQQLYVEKILFNTKRLSDLAGSILFMSKIENQTIPTNQKLFDLDEQIRQSVLSLEAMWEPKDIEFDIELDDTMYFGNELQMHHVWNNLISNAIKFNPDCGTIRLRLHKSKKDIVFVIEDSGPGIPQEAQKHIFDKFYQADSSHKQEGHGLGLAMVAQILKLEGGTIAVENIPAGGCRFTVTLQNKNH